MLQRPTRSTIMIPPPAPARRPLIKRGAVTVTLQPCAVHWNGVPVGLSPIEAVLLCALVRRSRLRWDEIDALLIEHRCCPESRDVLIHRIRRKFAAVGAADPIETLRGRGARFRTEADHQGCAAFWIGGSADAGALNA
jgi:DNA-binding response OmpR family regulator